MPKKIVAKTAEATEAPKLTVSTDISTLSKDSDIGTVLQLRWNKLERDSAKALITLDKPLGDLLCKARAALEDGQKQIPSKTLNHLNVAKIDRRRRSSAERLARDWNVEVSHMEGKTVGELLPLANGHLLTAFSMLLTSQPVRLKPPSVRQLKLLRRLKLKLLKQRPQRLLRSR